MTKENTVSDTLDMQAIMAVIGSSAKSAAALLAQTSTDEINTVLKDISGAITHSKEQIIKANRQDLDGAKNKNLTPISHCAGFKYQLAGLRNCHKKSSNPFIRYC